MFIPFFCHFVTLVKAQLSVDHMNLPPSPGEAQSLWLVTSLNSFLFLAEQDIPYFQSLKATQSSGSRLRCHRQWKITVPLLPLAQGEAKPTKELSAVQVEDSASVLLAYWWQWWNFVKKRVREQCYMRIARHQTRCEYDWFTKLLLLSLILQKKKK